MKLRYAYSLILSLILALPLQASEDSWSAPRPLAQLSRDPTMIPKGKGLLFVPTMTSRLQEPNYQIFQNGKKIATAETGTGVLLSPGFYEVLIGSGAISQMMRRPVEIVERMTTLIKPWWTGLVIDVKDETRASINESYELFDEGSQEPYGIGFGVEEERGEAVDTWLLMPGVYTIVKVGENIATPRKFSVRLLPGELTQRSLVVDNSGSFIGFYPPSYLQLARQTASNWNSNWELSMSAQFNTTQNTAGDDRASINFSGAIRNRSRYSTERHFGDIRITLEEGFTKEGEDALRKSVDEVEIRSTYIFRLSRRLGPYLRGVLKSNLFPKDERFDSPQNLLLIDPEGAVISTRRNISEFTLEPSFFPLELRQGIGINSQLYRSFPLNVNLRIGLGVRQNYVSDSYKLSNDRTRVTELENSTSTGLEALLIMDARLGRYLSLDSEFDILMPSAKTESWQFTFENRVRTFLTPFINMDVVLDFERQKPLNRLQSSQQVLLRFVKFF